MKTLLLIDAHALIHRAFHALPPLTSPIGEPVQALYGLSSILLRIWRDEKPDYAAALLDRPEPTFRKEAFDAYKAHRPKAADELVSQIIKSRELFSAFHIKSFELPGYEADDLIGTLAEQFRKTRDFKIIILTGDLDTLQLVEDDKVVVRVLKTGISDSFIYNETAVKDRYQLPPKKMNDYKALVGDPSDNIPGIPGVGPKTAATLIQKFGSIEKLYANLDKEPKLKAKFGSNHKDAVLFKHLATIKRDAPIKVGSLQELAALPLEASLGEYFLSLGFESLVKRLGTSIGTGQAKKVIDQEKKNEVSFQELFTLPTSSQPVNETYLKEDFLSLSPKELASEKLKIGFNLKEKIKALKQEKLYLAEPFFDLGIGFWLLDSDAKKYDALTVGKKFLNRDWQESDEDYALSYKYLSQEIINQNLSKIFYHIEMPLIPVLADMEESGIKINKLDLQVLSKDIEGEVKKLVKKIYETAGQKINLNSPKQLSALLFDELKLGDKSIKKTKTGQRSTNIDTLVTLKGAHPIIQLLINYRELFKLQSTYILPTLNLVSGDGRLHTDFVQTGAATGRLSSQNPNLQNIPAALEFTSGEENWAKRLRAVFIAPPRHLLAALDYSQLELRILASVTEDKKMIETFNRGEDIHKSTASAIFKVGLDAVTKDMRRLAKTLNFGIVYGMGADAFAKTAGISRDESREFIQDYFALYPGIKIWHTKIKEEGRQTGFVTNINGRRRSVKGITYGASRIASDMERVAINMPIQSLNADIIKLAMIEIARQLDAQKLPKEKVRMLLSIHDELLFEIDESIIDSMVAALKQIMETIFSLSVPLVVNAKTGKDWGSLTG